MDNPISVLLCDDHQIVRMGLKTVIELKEGFSVVGEACNGEEAVELARQLHPSVIVMDIMMPRKNGVEAIREILENDSEAKILVLTTFGASDETARALQAGARGAVVKDTPYPEFIRAIRMTAAGERVIGEGIRTTIGSDAPALTERQLAVLREVAAGRTTKRIAEDLGLTVDGVNCHLRAIYAKLGVSSRAEAIALTHEMRRGGAC